MMFLGQLNHRLTQRLKKVVDRARALSPKARKTSKDLSAQRDQCMTMLDEYSRRGSYEPQAKKVLVDGMWYNANYWVRYCMVRQALGLSQSQETGLLGEFGRTETKECFTKFGITTSVDFLKENQKSKNLKAAREILDTLSEPSDILNVQLPLNLPSVVLYDGILKRQRRGVANLDDPAIVYYIAECLGSIAAADRIITDGQYDLIVMSQVMDYTYSALAWVALCKKIPVLVLYGDYGTSRFLKMGVGQDIFSYPIRPSIHHLQQMSPQSKQALTEIGATAIDRRLSGQTSDVGSIYAYHRRTASIDKYQIAERFAWNPEDPIIGVYASNWFDFPHITDMPFFDDFVDWSVTTLDAAKKTKNVNWLFKSHPCDEWYGSIRSKRLEDFVTDAAKPNIRSADKSWSGADLIAALDGIVTCHGTVGIEATTRGTPVLIGYTGWYGHAGFTKTPSSREEYVQALQSQWWKEFSPETICEKSSLFAGWYFAVPSWTNGFVFPDDSLQDQTLKTIPEFFEKNAAEIVKEIEEIQSWYESEDPYFHIYKMSRADAFQNLY